VRRLLLALAERGERRAHRLRWSVWRRAHQALANRCHARRRSDERGGLVAARATVPVSSAYAPLTDAEWEQLRPLLPPQRPPVGRPRHPHRPILEGILWVVGTRSSWRDLPNQFGKWDTAYGRYRLWRATGLWQRILTALGKEEPSSI
jgi:hypothetical protein